MASWILVPCLVSLRNEFNRLAPGRDVASDGAIGDTSHAAASSDHNPDETGNTPYADADDTNEVHAIDVDATLRKPGWTMTKCVEIIVTRHREGRDNRLQNVIYNRRIWSRSWGWTTREYTGASAHTEHAHFSARYTTAQERDTSPWGLLEGDDVSAADVWNTDGLIKNPAWRPDGATNPFIAGKTALQVLMSEAHAANVKAGQAAAAQAQLAAQTATILKAVTGGVVTPEVIRTEFMKFRTDITATIVEQAIPLLAEQLAGQLDDITQDQLAQAVETVQRKLAAELAAGGTGA